MEITRDNVKEVMSNALKDLKNMSFDMETHLKGNPAELKLLNEIFNKSIIE